MKILFVCSGNTCRSPMAEYLFKAKAASLGLPISCSSAGLAAFTGDEASENAVIAMNELGIDISAHRSKKLSVYDLEEADVVVCMSESHRSALLCKEKCLVVPGGVPDPFGGDLNAYRACRDKLCEFVDSFIRQLTDFDIFEMSGGDIKEIALLEKECFSTPWSENALEAELSQETAHFFVAKVFGKVCGYIGMHIVLDECYITNVAVTKPLRKLGMASALINKSQQTAKRLGCSFISLEVRQSNTAAVSLYKKSGFEICGERKNFYSKPTENAYIMTKKFICLNKQISE